MIWIYDRHEVRSLIDTAQQHVQNEGNSFQFKSFSLIEEIFFTSVIAPDFNTSQLIPFVFYYIPVDWKS